MNIEKLKYKNLKGEIQYLPTWFINSTEEEIADAINIILEEEKNPKTYIVEPAVYDVDALITQLKCAGYKSHQIDQIIADVQCGRTLDSAMQRF